MALDTADMADMADMATDTMPPTDTPPPAARRPPFAHLRPYAVVAGLYAAAAVVWAIAGDVLPGGRWVSVHLFTLGMVTTVIPAFTRHFTATLTRQPERWPWWSPVLLNVGILAVLAGRVHNILVATAVGGTLVTAVVAANWADLRGMRRRALGTRFSWVVRMYERAHEAFVVGAVLGVLIGTGVLGGVWYGGARLAHLHASILGWGGLTLLATLVFFGPTVLRTRMEPGADVHARQWLPRAAAGLLVATVALLLTGLGGLWATPARLVAAGGLAVFAAGAVSVCLPVQRVATRAGTTFSGSLLQAACWWIVAAAAADVLVVAAGAWRLLDAVGVAFLVGALGLSIVGSIGYVAPMFASADPQARSHIRDVVEWAATPRAVVLNVGVALVVLAAALGPAAGVFGTWANRAGWTVVAVSLLAQLGAAVLAPPRRL